MPAYVQFDPYTVKGALYRPEPGRERSVAVLLIHRVNNYLGHLAAWVRATTRRPARSARSPCHGLRDNEMLYEMASSADKDFFVVEGATHNLEPCTECESRKGQYGNATKNFFNYAARWLSARY
jgi:hypothetical protein